MEPTVKITKNFPQGKEPTQPTKQVEIPEPQPSFEPTQQVQVATFPTNAISLPSKGLLYPENSILRQGYVEMKFMTAREENILTTESYIKQGIVIDKFLQSMLITKFNYDELLVGDKDALIVASRIYGYGEQYEVEVSTPSGKKQKVTINLEELENKPFDETLFLHGDNRFNYSFTNRVGTYNLEFKLLTIGDQKKIDEKLKRFKTAGSPDTQITTRLEQMILSVNGNADPNFIKMFISSDFLATDARKFREYVASIQPGVNMEVELTDEESGDSFRTSVTIGANFFWPDL